MTIYLVSYDKKKDKNYQPIWNALKGVGGHRVLESLWLINVTNQPQQVLDWISEFGDGDDSFIVAAINKSNLKTLRPYQGTTKWLEANA